MTRDLWTIRLNVTAKPRRCFRCLKQDAECKCVASELKDAFSEFLSNSIPQDDHK